MRFLVAILLLVSITPGASEVIDTAMHAITHGDLPHHEQDRGCSEHTCTPLSHHCGCHGTMSAHPQGQHVATISVLGFTDVVPPVVTLFRGRSTEPPLLRPPIA